MLNKKKLFQLILFSFGIIIIFLTYFSNFQKNPTVKEVKEEEILNQEFLVEGVNRFENVVCIFTFKDKTILTVNSDKGIYNNITNDMKFTENVKMDYLENIIFSDRAAFNNFENQLLVAGNIKGEGPTTNLQADELDFDLNTKDLKISMYSLERVNVKTKF